jgi:hypothetical protein
MRGGITFMRRWAGITLRFSALIILMAGAARGQEQPAMSSGAGEAHGFGAIRLMPDAQAGTQNGNSQGETIAVKKSAATTHRFWDKQNILLFAGVGAARGLDYASTLNMRRRGVNEELLNNDVVDNHAEFAAIEAATAMASVGLSAIWHYTGHHRLERWTSYIHIGVTVAGAGRNYALKTVHPAPM